jgi:hypothetical protein
MIRYDDAGRPNIVLIDFNVAKRFRDPKTHNKLLLLTTTGAQNFAAPEVYETKSYE